MSSYPLCPDSPYEDVECSVDVPNDACEDAIPAIVEESYTGFTHYALGSSELPGCEYCYGPDVWYSFTPDTSGNYTFSLCGSDFDTVLEVFAGDCGALELVGINDDGICGSQSAFAGKLTGGQTYLVRISGFGASTGNYELQITLGVQNDTCEDAIPATVGETYTGVTDLALGSGELPGCEQCYGPDVWYTFTPDTSGTYSFSLCGSDFDTVLEVFAGDCGALDLIGINDDGICGSQSVLAVGLSGGQTYQIRISGDSGLTGNYELQIRRGVKATIGCNVGDGPVGASPGEALILALTVALMAFGCLRPRVGRKIV